jgi:hypothetical protein
MPLPALGGGGYQVVKGLQTLHMGKERAAVGNGLRSTFTVPLLLHQLGTPTRSIHIVLSAEFYMGTGNRDSVGSDMDVGDGGFLHIIRTVLNRGIEQKLIYLLAVEVALTVEGQVRRHKLMQLGRLQRHSFCVVSKSNAVLEATGRGDVVDDPIGVTQMTDFGNPEALTNNERPDGTLGKQSLSQGKSRVFAPFDDEDFQAGLCQNGGHGCPVNTRTGNDDIVFLSGVLHGI